MVHGINCLFDPVNKIDPNGLDWTYQQSTGDLYHQPSDQLGGGPPALIDDTGYAGHGEGVNNPNAQNAENIGPLPQGNYTIGTQQDNITNTGTNLQQSMRLTPDPNNEMYGRSGFIIHSDNNNGNQTASEGCPVFNRNTRNQIGNSGDNSLRVTR